MAYLSRRTLLRSSLLATAAGMIIPLVPSQAAYRLAQKVNHFKDFLPSGGVLNPGDDVLSLNGNFQLILQNDGNLVLYDISKKPHNGLWSSNTQGQPVKNCIMQADGNLVIYSSSNNPIWDSKTAGNPGSFLRVQNDGNTVIYGPIWNTNTVQ